MTHSIALIFLALTGTAQATYIKNFHYPIANPLRATLTVGLLKPLESPKPKIYSIPQSEKVVPAHREAAPLRFGFFEGPAGAPLVFMQGGLMASFEADKDIYRAQVLNKEGFHVVLLSSPLFPNDMSNLLRSGIGGNIRQDAEALYELMIKIRAGLRRQGIRWSKIQQVGFSMGGIHAAFIAEMDSRRNSLGFEKTLLLNPPVDMEHGIRAIDSFQSAIDRKGFFNTVTTLLGALFTLKTHESEEELYSSAYFSNWDSQLDLSDEDVKAILSYYFKSSVADINRQALRSVERFKGNNPCYLRSESSVFMDYVSNIVVPLSFGLRRSNCALEDRPAMTKRVLKAFSLTAFTSYLAQADNVYVFHNVDDFILRPSDVEYLENTFQERASLFPLGGHSGSIWYPEYQKRMVRVLR